jgi:hypothetical protein
MAGINCWVFRDLPETSLALVRAHEFAWIVAQWTIDHMKRRKASARMIVDSGV